MSSTEGPFKEDVMAWDPKKLADYMKKLKLFSCDTVVLKRGITGAQFLQMIQYELEVFPIIHIPILAKIQRDLNVQEKRKGFASKFKTQNSSSRVPSKKVWNSNEFDSGSDNDYEEFNQEANYILPLTEPQTADSHGEVKAKEDDRFQPVFSLPQPQRASTGPCYAQAHLSKVATTVKKPEKPPPQRAFSHLAESGVVVATGSLSRRRPLPTVPQLDVSTSAYNQIADVPVPKQCVHLNQTIRTSGQVNKHVQGLDPSWYRGRMTRAQAEVSLWKENKDGAFLVRDSLHGSTQHPYTLMLLNQGKIYNIKIQRKNDFFYLGSGTNNPKSFLRVKEMIIHHMNTPLLLIDATDQSSEEQPQCCLLHPVGL